MPYRVERRVARSTARQVPHHMALAEEDVKKLEQETGQPAESPTEEQPLATTKKLGIKKLNSTTAAKP
jgi:hypothetical protein